MTDIPVLGSAEPYAPPHIERHVRALLLKRVLVWELSHPPDFSPEEIAVANSRLAYLESVTPTHLRPELITYLYAVEFITASDLASFELEADRLRSATP